MNEFAMIARYFRPLTQGRAEAQGLLHDTAVLKVPKGYELVVSSDTLNAGTHFFANATPENIAHKALRSNLSDLAAAGAKPYVYQMCIAFPKRPTELWIKKFSAALLKDQKEFGIFCSGGDTTSIKSALSITMTVFGLVPAGTALNRGGAKPGDVLVVTGPVGDAWMGLKILQKKLKFKSPSAVAAYQTPTPRTAVSDIVRTHARAAVDVSDGLIADAGHIAQASKLALTIDLDKLKFSSSATRALKAGLVTVQDLVTGGDDYELALAVPPAKLPVLLKKLKARGLKPQVVGRFTKGKPVVTLHQAGRPIHFTKSGWQHF